MAETPRIAVLLGAGASADAGIPTTIGMTDKIIDRVQRPEHALILQFIRHTLEADLARRAQETPAWGEPPELHVDIERLFAAVDLLIDREDQPWSPFVTGWHGGLEAFAPTPRLTSHDVTTQLNEVERALIQMISGAAKGRRPCTSIPTRGVRQALERLLQQSFRRFTPGDVSALLSGARSEMLHSLFDVLRIDDPERVRYLAPLIDVAKKQGELTIATLNYDRGVENAAELAGFSCDTVIEGWLEHGRLTLGRSGLRLLKLHGSIDWVFERGQEQGRLPQQRIRKVTENEKARYDRPAVVFGEGGKLRSEGPFLELLLAWSSALRAVDNLLIVGYSLRDAHVNELIARWFNSEEDRRIVLLSPHDISAATRKDFGWYLKQLDARVPKPRQPSNCRFVHVIGSAREQMPDAIAEASTPLVAVEKS
jgi:SIR2-like domain